MIIIGIIVAIILFSVIVLIHEWGHFAAARKFGVKVEEFGLGIPPRAKKLFRDKKGTLFSLNWLPIGGFVKLTGEQPNTFLIFDKNKNSLNNLEIEKYITEGKDLFDKNGNKIGKYELDEVLIKIKENDSEHNLMNKPAWQQAIIILAGIFMNFVLAWIIFSILFFVGVKPIGINNKIDTNLELKLIPTQDQAIENGILIKNDGLKLFPINGSISEKAGIENNDILENISYCKNGIIKGKICSSGEEITKVETNNPETLINQIKINAGNFLTFEFKNKENIEILIPVSGIIGSYLSENIEINKDFKYEYGFFESVKYGAIETKNQILLTFKGLNYLLKKIFNPETPEERQEAIKQVSGPIGIVDFISNSITAGVVFILVIGAIISINLGVFNLLPIPALDGGRFLFITINGLIEKIFGKKAISDKIESYIHAGFFIVLIALSLLIAYNDVSKIISN